MANPWWADLGVRSNAMLNGLANTPFVLDPADLSGDATYNRSLLYSGSVPKPAPTVNPVPNMSLGMPGGGGGGMGMAPPQLGNQFASTGAATAAPAPAAPASPFAPMAMAALSAPSAAAGGAGATPAGAGQPTPPSAHPFANIEWVDDTARKNGEAYLADLQSRGAFDPSQAYEGLIPAIQRRLTYIGAKPQAGWSAEGGAAPQVPKGVEGFYAMTGQRATPILDDSGAYTNRNEYHNSYQFVPTAQPQQTPQMSIPPELQNAVSQLFQNWFGGQNG